MAAIGQGETAMEKDVLARLKRLVDNGGIEPSAFFRLCALMGVSFAAAMLVAQSTPALAQRMASASLTASSYAELVGPDVISYINVLAVANGINGDETGDEPFSKASTVPFSKFSKS